MKVPRTFIQLSSIGLLILWLNGILFCQQNEPPILLWFNVHIEPMNGTITNPLHGETDTTYRGNMRELLWLRDSIAVALGTKISVQSNGEFFEYVLDNGDEEKIRSFIELGFDFGTHIHSFRREGPHNWVRYNWDVPDWFDRTIWDSNIQFADSVLGKENNYHINAYWCPHYYYLVSEYPKFLYIASMGLPMTIEARRFLKHPSWNPFRPSMEPGKLLEEDLTRSYVLLPNHHQIGLLAPEEFADVRVETLKRQFLMIYVEWLSRIRNNTPDKIWLWGFSTHTQFNANVHDDIIEMANWLNENFVGKTTASGDTIAIWASSRKIYERFLDWEKAHPNESSFSYTRGGPYPYTYPALPVLLDSTTFVRKIPVAEGVECYQLDKNGKPIFLIWCESGNTTVDLSAYLSDYVNTVDGFGNDAVFPSNSISITPDPLILLSATTGVNTRRDKSVINSFSIFPTPARNRIKIQYGIINSAPVSLKIFNILGGEVKTLVNGVQTPGKYSIIWDGKNNQGIWSAMDFIFSNLN